MTISVLQERQTSSGSGTVSSIVLAFSNPVVVGSSFHSICQSADNAASYTCSDSVNGSHGAALDNIDAPADATRAAHFKFDNTASGTPTVTITPNVSAGFPGIWIREIGGTSGYDTHAGQLQTHPVGTGPDALTSGTAIPASQPGLVSGLSVDCTGGTVMNTGTGFTSTLSGWQFGFGVDFARAEHLRYTSTSALAATFTQGGVSDNYLTVAAFFKEGGTVATTGWAPPISSAHPGRSPGRSQRFYQSPKAYNAAGSGILAGIDGLTFGQTGTLTGAGVLAGTAALTFGQTGNLTGVGALAGTSGLVFAQTGAITGAGALVGTSGLVFGQTGALTGAGALAGSSALLFNETGALTGAGALSGSSAVVFGQTGAIVGAGALTGSSALAFGQTGTLTGSGLLSGLSALTFGASATADVPSGSISGTTAITLAASGTLTATGTLAGIAAMLFGAFGALDQPNTTQPGPVDSPRSAEGWRRKKRKRKLLPEPVFVSPASFEHAPPQAVIDTVPDFTALAQTLGEAPAALSARIDREIEFLMREHAERDDEEALVLILTALD